MCTDTDHPPTKEQLDCRKALGVDVRKVLEKALADEEYYAPDALDEEVAKKQRLDMMREVEGIDAETDMMHYSGLSCRLYML